MNTDLIQAYMSNERRKRQLREPRRMQREAEKKWFERMTGIKVDPCFHWVEGYGFVERPAHRQATDAVVKIVDGKQYTWLKLVSETMKRGGNITQAAQRWDTGRLAHVPPSVAEKALNWQRNNRPAAEPLRMPPRPLVLPFEKRDAARQAGAKLAEPVSSETYEFLRQNRVPPPMAPAPPPAPVPRYPPPPRPRMPEPPYFPWEPMREIFGRYPGTETREQIARQIRVEGMMRRMQAIERARREAGPIQVQQTWRQQPWTGLLFDKNKTPTEITKLQLEKLWNLGFRLKPGGHTELKGAHLGGGIPQTGALGRLAYILNNLHHWYKRTANIPAAQEARAILRRYYPDGIPIVTKGDWYRQDDRYFEAVEAAFGPYTQDNWSGHGIGAALESLRKMYPQLK